MTNSKRGKFSNKAKAILEPEPPHGLSDFLGEEESNRNTGNADTRNPVYTERHTSKPPLKTIREEFRFPEEVAETLRTYAFQKRTTKTAVVLAALEEFFKRKKVSYGFIKKQ